jgi:hypothetical protein
MGGLPCCAKTTDLSDRNEGYKAIESTNAKSIKRNTTADTKIHTSCSLLSTDTALSKIYNICPSSSERYATGNLPKFCLYCFSSFPSPLNMERYKNARSSIVNKLNYTLNCGKCHSTLLLNQNEHAAGYHECIHKSTRNAKLR